MSRARHPGPYKQGKRKEMTRAWKLRVHEELKINEKESRSPANIPELARMVKADKRGMYVTLDPDGEQTSSTYVDDICRLLKIPQPLVESEDDEEFQRDVALLRSLSRDARRALLSPAVFMDKEAKKQK